MAKKLKYYKDVDSAITLVKGVAKNLAGTKLVIDVPETPEKAAHKKTIPAATQTDLKYLLDNDAGKWDRLIIEVEDEKGDDK